MRYLSVCSGIEAATVAWHPLRWEPVAFAEIEPFPRAVLKHHYPKVPLHGDFTAIQGDEHGAIDLMVGGTPCQSFSVAGLRGGLADDRGNLALEFLRLADRTRPRWVVWENVPGVLSSRGGRDFGSILGGLVELGYGFAYRVLDAQYFGVAQRRRRVFVVGCLGDWRRAAAVLFERDCLSGNPAPSREARKGTAQNVKGRVGGGHEVAHSLRGENFDASENGTGRGTPLLPVALHCRDLAQTITSNYGKQVDNSDTALGPNIVAFRWQNEDAGIVTDTIAASLRAKGTTTDERSVGAYVACIHADSVGRTGDAITPSADAEGRIRLRPPGLGLADDGSSYNLMASGQPHAVATAMAVRRLTPRECERLQGFPGDYTAIPWRGKEAPDGPRYKALGNSMAVPVMRWIGERINMVDK